VRLIKLLLALIIIADGSYLVIKTPQLHRDFLRYKVGRAVVKVVKMNDDGQVLGGGTGFSILVKGRKYILTNAHVCDMYEGGHIAVIEMPDGTFKQRPIKAISGDTDLCIIDGIAELPTVSLAKSVSLGEIVAVVGHPMLMPLNISYGDIIGETIATVAIGFADMKCDLPKNKIMGFYCVEQVEAYQTTATALPGNSGSPVVNWRRQVIGVLFAGDSSINWGMVIPLYDVQNFLNNI
jgi:S1-C subfamily serine protease